MSNLHLYQQGKVPAFRIMMPAEIDDGRCLLCGDVRPDSNRLTCGASNCPEWLAVTLAFEREHPEIGTGMPVQ